MSLEDYDTSNLPELTPISSNQHVKKAIQNSTITTVDNSVNASLKTLMEEHVAMPLNINKLTNTFYDQLKNLTSILKDNVNVEQPQSISSTSCQNQSLVVQTRY